MTTDSVNKWFVKGLEELEIRTRVRDYANNSTLKVDQNTLKSTGDMNTLAVTWSPMKTINWCRREKPSKE